MLLLLILRVITKHTQNPLIKQKKTYCVNVKLDDAKEVSPVEGGWSGVQSSWPAPKGSNQNTISSEQSGPCIQFPAGYFTEATEAIVSIPLVTALMPLKCSSKNLRFTHRVPFLP